MPVALVRRRDFVTGMGAIAVLAANTPKLFADERVFGVRRLRRRDSSGIAFPAIAAASMPEILVIGDSVPGVPMRGHADIEKSIARVGYLELRRYRFDREEDRSLALAFFLRVGMEPLLIGEAGNFLFGFDTLATREKAWREIIAEPQWDELRAQLEDLAIYKVGAATVRERPHRFLTTF